MSTFSTTGDEIDSALEIIEANGGVGEWEAENTAPTPRWEFPRFHGATEPADMYLSRAGLGPYDTDVEMVGAWLEAPRNIVGGIFIEGEPGGGKTALAESTVTHLARPCKKHGNTGYSIECHAAGKGCTPRPMLTHLCTPDDTRETLMLRFVGEGKGINGTPYELGPLAYAAIHGYIFYADEFLLTSDAVKPVYYECMDGRRFLSGANVDGTAAEFHPDFRMIISSNPLVRGASLPEPIGSRVAGTSITVETDASLLRDLGLDEGVVAAWEAVVTLGGWHPQVRELRVADYWLPIDAGQAVSAFVPPHCPESQRKAIRDTAVGFLGGNIREDGRLVVR